MSLFPRSLIKADPSITSFQPLFRMLDDFDRYNREGDTAFRTHAKMFTPKFDLKELKETYELHGELPGIEQKDVEIEFTDNHTLTIKGRSERSYTSGTPPAGFVEGAPARGAIAEREHGHQATVEDENADKATGAADREESQQPEDQAKYWVSERSVGEFSRSFTFPATVDQDRVTASMKNGILTILVPKSKKPEARKITIS